jgi:type IV pilus assembly protein PilE
MVTQRSRIAGITLIELLCVISIIGILAAISYPMFAEQSAKGRRASARALMFQVLQNEERYYTGNNTYTTDLTALGLPAALQTDQGTHSIALAIGPTGDLTTSVSITGTALVPDAKCTSLTLTSANAQTGTGSQPSVCW